MPRGDQTGPRGMGPMTGRAAGFCAGLQARPALQIPHREPDADSEWAADAAFEEVAASAGAGHTGWRPRRIQVRLASGT